MLTTYKRALTRSMEKIGVGILGPIRAHMINPGGRLLTPTGEQTVRPALKRSVKNVN